MTTETMNENQFNEIKRDLADLKSKVEALPDRAAVWTTTIAVHGIVWGTVVGTVVLLNTLGKIS